MLFRHTLHCDYTIKCHANNSITPTETDFKTRYGSLIDDKKLTNCSNTSLHMTINESEDVPNTIYLCAFEHAVLEHREYEGEFFIFLMSHAMSSKTDSYVGYTRNPIRDVIRHNDKTIPDRNTSMAAPYWNLDIVLGPFVCKEHAIDCARSWVSGTRGKIAKRKKAPFLSSAYNVPMYHYNESMTIDQFEDILKKNVSPIYTEILKDITNK